MAPIVGYWDLRGCAEPIRYLLNYVGIEFEDKRYKLGNGPEFDKSDWLNEKEALGLDFPNLPYYIDGDVKLSQSSVILRYLARKHGLLAKTEEDTIRVELAEQEIVDMRMALVKTCYIHYGGKFEAKREQRLEELPYELGRLSTFLGDNEFVAGDYLTYADFMVYDTLDFYRLFEPSSLDAFENLKNYLNRVEGLPQMSDYINSPKFSRFPIWGLMASWGGSRPE